MVEHEFNKSLAQSYVSVDFVYLCELIQSFSSYRIEMSLLFCERGQSQVQYCNYLWTLYTRCPACKYFWASPFTVGLFESLCWTVMPMFIRYFVIRRYARYCDPNIIIIVPGGLQQTQNFSFHDPYINLRFIEFLPDIRCP